MFISVYLYIYICVCVRVSVCECVCVSVCLRSSVNRLGLKNSRLTFHQFVGRLDLPNSVSKNLKEIFLVGSVKPLH